MAHNLTIRKNGFAEMAFTGNRKAIWHNLGQEVPEGASLEDWIQLAGLNWEVFETSIHYLVSPTRGFIEDRVIPKQKLLYRSDTLEPLSIVSENFQIVQPYEIIEFFRDLIDLHGMKLSTAGSLFGGKKFWALAKFAEDEVTPGDVVESYLLLITGVDGQTATVAKTTSVRVVCNNTLTIALRSNAKLLVTRTHHKPFDPTGIKIDLGLIEASWGRFMENIKRLAATPMPRVYAKEFFKHLMHAETLEDPRVKRLIHIYDAQPMEESVWKTLNAVTELYTHGIRPPRKDSSYRFWSSLMGEYDRIKLEAYNQLLTA